MCFEQFLQYRVMHFIRDFYSFKHLGIDMLVYPDKIVAYDLYRKNSVVSENFYRLESCVLYFLCSFDGYFLAFFRQDFSGRRVHNGFSSNFLCNSVEKPQLLVEFISSDLCQVISLGIKKQRINQALRVFDDRGFTRPELFVNLEKGLFLIGRAVFIQRILQTFCFIKKCQYFFVRFITQRP